MIYLSEVEQKGYIPTNIQDISVPLYGRQHFTPITGNFVFRSKPITGVFITTQHTLEYSNFIFTNIISERITGTFVDTTDIGKVFAGFTGTFSTSLAISDAVLQGVFALVDTIENKNVVSSIFLLLSEIESFEGEDDPFIPIVPKPEQGDFIPKERTGHKVYVTITEAAGDLDGYYTLPKP